MKYRVLFLFFLMYFLFPENYSKCMGPIGCFNPLSAEYGWHGIPEPSFGYQGGVYRIHPYSAYVSSFWTKVSNCVSFFSPMSFTLSSGYRCPQWNAHEDGDPGSYHQYGNAADHLVSSDPDYWASQWQEYGSFAHKITYIAPSRFHVDDGMK